MLIRIKKLSYIGPLSYNISMLSTELSILALYMRLFSFTRRGRVVCYVVIGLATLNACAGVIVNFVLKTRSDVERDKGLKILWYVNSGLALPIDFTIWYLPIPMIFKLQKMDRKKKIGLFVTFSLGLMCPITALGRLCVIKEAASFHGDLAWKMTYVHILTSAETGMAITAVSMAALRPLLSLIGNWCNGKPGSLSRTGDSGFQGTGRSQETRGTKERSGSEMYDSEHRHSLHRTEDGTPGLGTGLSGTKTATEGARVVIKASDIEMYGTEHNIHRVKAAQHTDIELGTINTSTESIPPALCHPPKAVSRPGDTDSGTNRKSPGTRLTGILRTFTDSHITRNDRDRDNNGTTSQQEESESTTSLTGGECDQSEH